MDGGLAHLTLAPSCDGKSIVIKLWIRLFTFKIQANVVFQLQYCSELLSPKPKRRRFLAANIAIKDIVWRKPVALRYSDSPRHSTSYQCLALSLPRTQPLVLLIPRAKSATTFLAQATTVSTDVVNFIGRRDFAAAGFESLGEWQILLEPVPSSSLSFSCLYLWLAHEQAHSIRWWVYHFSDDCFAMTWQCPWMKNSHK